jgi:protein phosphatase
MSPPTNEIFVELFGRTDVGQHRKHNEDTFLVADLTARARSLKPEVRRHRLGANGTLLVVCDGMGGAAAGEVASQMAADTIYSHVTAAPQPSDRKALVGRLHAALENANQRIREMAARDISRTGMGTTCSACGIIGTTLVAAQVGDSRVYVIRGGRIAQVTRDQSLLNQMLDTGQITEEAAASFQHRNVILQALGVVESVEPVFTSVGLCRGDIVVACSDGLSDSVSDGEILSVVEEAGGDLVVACKSLTATANRAGGPDNITVLLAEVRGAGLPESTEQEISVEPVACEEARAQGRPKSGDLAKTETLPGRPGLAPRRE